MSEKKKLGNIMYKPNPAQKAVDSYQQASSDSFQQTKRWDIVKGLKKLMKGKEDLTMDKMITSKFKGDKYKSKASAGHGNFANPFNEYVVKKIKNMGRFGN
ncbi:hypothetical protein [uncultured Mediterranean phage uvMED]|nr:hypothetical protein [uncultured Mediterranean phage uvMED]BAQ87222.1 hypothetical protein [uncultured Mediterranean phage uvMED]BAQ87237.1 hypothetical protein [uncultured Mediterranean phage uvMED]BAQ87308.1 hypothetical protein [uncultured Mediterranean phage uvMED]BAQ87362.1 hypothetical protein [uncultured Mediterranean phage uvMED]|tara:strand:+ start:80 stop:382 length:303 start_codon:yes stop_codon:yes gene_type:complete